MDKKERRLHTADRRLWPSAPGQARSFPGSN